MNKRGIVHPRLMVDLREGFYPSCCTIQDGVEVQSDTGHVTYTYTDLCGHVDLPCRIAPATAGSSGQVDRSDSIIEDTTHTIALNGRYDAIQATMMAVVDGVTYDVRRVDGDDQDEMTVLRARLVQ